MSEPAKIGIDNDNLTFFSVWVYASMDGGNKIVHSRYLDIKELINFKNEIELIIHARNEDLFNKILKQLKMK